MENLPTILSAVDTEMHAIESTMGTRAYVNDEVTQARYRALVDRKRELAEASGPTILENPLQIASRDEFLRAVPGGDYGAYVTLNRQAADVFLAIPEDEQPGFVASFEALSDAVAGEMLAELMRRPPVVASLPPDERQWAIVEARLFRIADALDDDDANAFLAWHDRLSNRAALAVYRKLAA